MIPFVKQSDTSKAAAGKMLSKAATLRETVYSYILQKGQDGATDQEIQDATGMDQSTQRPRRVELAKAGRIGKNGHTRATTSGRQAAVWVASIYLEDEQDRLF